MTTALNAQNLNELNLKDIQVNKESLNKLLKDRGLDKEREKEIRENGGVLKESEIPKELLFRHKDIKKGRMLIAGRVAMKAGAGGDRVVFHTFDGQEVNSSSFKREDLEKELKEKLADTKSIPVKLIVNITEGKVMAGNSVGTYITLEYVYSCEIVNADSICEAAKKQGLTEYDCTEFKANFVTPTRK